MRHWNENKEADNCFYCCTKGEVGEGHCWGAKVYKEGGAILAKRKRRRSKVAHKVCLVMRWSSTPWGKSNEEFLAELLGQTVEETEVDRLNRETTWPMAQAVEEEVPF